MGRADQRLYAALLRMSRQFQSEKLPLVGVACTDLVCGNLDWRTAVRQAVERPPPGLGLAEGARLLTLLHKQHEVLLQAEEHTREALAEWAALADRFQPAQRGRGAPGGSQMVPVAAAAAEEGLALLTRQAQALTDPFQLDPVQPADDACAATSLDALAADVQQQHPALFAGSGSKQQAAASDGEAVRKLEAVLDGVYRRHRFRYEPFEWVYEGLHPLLLPAQLHRRKLAPLTLGVLTAGVARRLGMALLPVPVESGNGIAATTLEGPAGGAASQGELPLEKLRPDVAQRYAGRAQGMAPAAAPWVLLLASGGSLESIAHCSADGGRCTGDGQRSQQQQWSHVVDACTGEVLAAAAAQHKFPELQLATDWPQRAPLVSWQHMIRTVIQAHQRRGESDLVAHWVYVLLALDPQAPEWQHMLSN